MNLTEIYNFSKYPYVIQQRKLQNEDKGKPQEVIDLIRFVPKNKHSEKAAYRTAQRRKQKQGKISDSGLSFLCKALIRSEKNEREKVHYRKITYYNSCFRHKGIL